MKWFRLYDEILDDPKVQMLPGEQFKFWINLMALANRSSTRGVVELSCQHIAWTLHIDATLTAQYLEELKAAGLLEECEDQKGVTPHNWNARQYKSDDVSARVQTFRNKGNVPLNKVGEGETLHETLHTHNDNVSLSVSVKSVNSESPSENTTGGAGGAEKPKRLRPVPKEAPLDNFTAAFEDFWEQYPRDRDGMKAGNKSKSRDAFRRINVADWDDVMAGLLRYKAVSKVLRGYVLNAETWLKEQKWKEALSAQAAPEVIENATHKPSRMAAAIGRMAGELMDEVQGNGASGAYAPNQTGYTAKCLIPPKGA